MQLEQWLKKRKKETLSVPKAGEVEWLRKEGKLEKETFVKKRLMQHWHIPKYI